MDFQLSAARSGAIRRLLFQCAMAVKKLLRGAERRPVQFFRAFDQAEA
jgi:hypothetical protein